VSFIDWQIVLGAVGAGMGAELIRRYRGFKTRRRSTPAAARNAGLLTDRRLYLAELIMCVAVVAAPFSVGILLVSADRPYWSAYLGLLAYSAMVFLLLKSLNTAEPQ
jgi:hypothetical protein